MPLCTQHAPLSPYQWFWGQKVCLCTYGYAYLSPFPRYKPPYKLIDGGTGFVCHGHEPGLGCCNNVKTHCSGSSDVLALMCARPEPKLIKKSKKLVYVAPKQWTAYASTYTYSVIRKRKVISLPIPMACTQYILY